MKKLELEHLAPYLPYELKYMVDGEFYNLDGLDVNGDAFDANTGEIPWLLIKPILSPLSNLTKEIEHNGERFIPVEEYSGTLGKQLLECSELSYSDLQFAHYRTIQVLLELHFDIFGSIEQGLAIDKNTING